MLPKYPEVKGKKIILGVTGGIAIYKVCSFIREIRRSQGEVKVVMTRNATRFITPLTFMTLTGNPVYEETFPDHYLPQPFHIRLGEWGEVLFVAPATANIIGKAASGIGDDLLSTLLLSFPGKIIFAPSMDEEMWRNPVVQENVKKLQDMGREVIPPEKGELASGKTGEGRLPSLENLMYFLRRAFLPQDMQGVNVLVTAGPTREYIDRIRFISNPSSGKMGFLLAEEASLRGGKVRLITGRVAIDTPPGVERIEVETAEDMKKEVEGNFPWCDVLIMNAAVGDFQVKERREGKIRREEGLTLHLEPTPDILKEVSLSRDKQVVVGFSLELDGVEERGWKKLKEKKVDILVGCLQKEGRSGFGEDSLEGLILFSDGKKEPYSLTKRETARKVMDRVIEIIKERRKKR